jgi:hypothetical protein
MIIIQHRANYLRDAHCEAAEIDVQIDRWGEVVVGHDLWSGPFKANFFLKHTEHQKFLIDIKQNLPIEKLQLIADTFGTRSMGLFDVPFPSAYFAIKEGLNVWGRLSEFEPVNHLFSKFWVDPLASQGEILSDLFCRTQLNHKLIIASPELHGHSLEFAIETWDAIKLKLQWPGAGGKPVGLVTKFPKEAQEFFNECK